MERRKRKDNSDFFYSINPQTAIAVFGFRGREFGAIWCPRHTTNIEETIVLLHKIKKYYLEYLEKTS